MYICNKEIIMIKILLLIISSFFSLGLYSQSKDSFELYIEKDADWYPSIFQLYIQEYSNLRVNKYLIDGQDTESIKMALEQFKYKETNNFDAAISAVQRGKKVFFFVETYVWGGLEMGTTFSGSWNRQMPLCSGFYVYKKKCFQNQGINYHCGKKDKAHLVTFMIMN